MDYSDFTLFSFEQLRVWKEARMLTREVYKLTYQLPDFEKFALGNQLRRAAISITSNIAEGSGRASYKEKIHFLEIAYGSLAEVYSQLILAVDLGYFAETDVVVLKPVFEYVAKLLSRLKYKFAENLKE